MSRVKGGIIEDLTVTERNLKDRNILSKNIIPSAVNGINLGLSSCGNSVIGSGEIHSDSLSDDSIDSTCITNREICEKHLLPEVISADHIAEAAIGQTQIEVSSVTENSISQDAKALLAMIDPLLQEKRAVLPVMSGEILRSGKIVEIAEDDIISYPESIGGIGSRNLFHTAISFPSQGCLNELYNLKLDSVRSVLIYTGQGEAYCAVARHSNSEFSVTSEPQTDLGSATLLQAAVISPNLVFIIYVASNQSWFLPVRVLGTDIDLGTAQDFTLLGAYENASLAPLNECCALIVYSFNEGDIAIRVGYVDPDTMSTADPLYYSTSEIVVLENASVKMVCNLNKSFDRDILFYGKGVLMSALIEGEVKYYPLTVNQSPAVSAYIGEEINSETEYAGPIVKASESRLVALEFYKISGYTGYFYRLRILEFGIVSGNFEITDRGTTELGYTPITDSTPFYMINMESSLKVSSDGVVLVTIRLGSPNSSFHVESIFVDITEDSPVIISRNDLALPYAYLPNICILENNAMSIAYGEFGTGHGYVCRLENKSEYRSGLIEKRESYDISGEHFIEYDSGPFLLNAVAETIVMSMLECNKLLCCYRQSGGSTGLYISQLFIRDNHSPSYWPIPANVQTTVLSNGYPQALKSVNERYALLLYRDVSTSKLYVRSVSSRNGSTGLGTACQIALSTTWENMCILNEKEALVVYNTGSGVTFYLISFSEELPGIAKISVPTSVSYNTFNLTSRPLLVKITNSRVLLIYISGSSCLGSILDREHPLGGVSLMITKGESVSLATVDNTTIEFCMISASRGILISSRGSSSSYGIGGKVFATLIDMSTDTPSIISEKLVYDGVNDSGDIIATGTNRGLISIRARDKNGSSSTTSIYSLLYDFEVDGDTIAIGKYRKCVTTSEGMKEFGREMLVSLGNEKAGILYITETNSYAVIRSIMCQGKTEARVMAYSQADTSYPGNSTVSLLENSRFIEAQGVVRGEHYSISGNQLVRASDRVVSGIDGFRKEPVIGIGHEGNILEIYPLQSVRTLRT